MNYVIYKTTNLINGKIYIGKHQTKNLNDGYIGSGKLLKRAIKKYGLDQFKTEIVEICPTEAHMNLAEKIYVVIDHEISYNLCPGGRGGFGYINMMKLGNPKEGRKQSNQSITAKYGIINPGQLQKTKEINRQRLKINHQDGKMIRGRFGQRGELDREIIDKNRTGERLEKRRATYARIGHSQGAKNSQFGKTRTEETKQKIRDSLKKTRESKTKHVQGKS